MGKANISVSLDTMQLARLDTLIEEEGSPYDSRTDAVGDAVEMLLEEQDSGGVDVE